MTFWDFLVVLFNWFESRTTRIIGVALGLVTTLVSTGIIPESHLKYYTAAIAVLTYLRGQFISNTVDTAKAIIQQQQADAASPVKTYVLQASPPPPKDPLP